MDLKRRRQERFSQKEDFHIIALHSRCVHIYCMHLYTYMCLLFWCFHTVCWCRRHFLVLFSHRALSSYSLFFSLSLGFYFVSKTVCVVSFRTVFLPSLGKSDRYIVYTENVCLRESIANKWRKENFNEMLSVYEPWFTFSYCWIIFSLSRLVGELSCGGIVCASAVFFSSLFGVVNGFRFDTHISNKYEWENSL